jgi:hypothetical protein
MATALPSTVAPQMPEIANTQITEASSSFEGDEIDGHAHVGTTHSKINEDEELLRTFGGTDERTTLMRMPSNEMPKMPIRTSPTTLRLSLPTMPICFYPYEIKKPYKLLKCQ